MKESVSPSKWKDMSTYTSLLDRSLKARPSLLQIPFILASLTSPSPFPPPTPFGIPNTGLPSSFTLTIELLNIGSITHQPRTPFFRRNLTGWNEVGFHPRIRRSSPRSHTSPFVRDGIEIPSRYFVEWVDVSHLAWYSRISHNAWADNA